MKLSEKFLTIDPSPTLLIDSKFKQMKADGLNSAMMTLMSTSRKDVIFDRNGLTCRAYNDITGEYEPEQFRLTNNILCFIPYFF